MAAATFTIPDHIYHSLFTKTNTLKKIKTPVVCHKDVYSLS